MDGKAEEHHRKPCRDDVVSTRASVVEKTAASAEEAAASAEEAAAAREQAEAEAAGFRTPGRFKLRVEEWDGESAAQPGMYEEWVPASQDSSLAGSVAATCDSRDHGAGDDDT